MQSHHFLHLRKVPKSQENKLQFYNPMNEKFKAYQINNKKKKLNYCWASFFSPVQGPRDI